MSVFRCCMRGRGVRSILSSIGYCASSRLSKTRNCEFVIVSDSRQMLTVYVQCELYFVTLHLQYYVSIPNFILES